MADDTVNLAVLVETIERIIADGRYDGVTLRKHEARALLDAIQRRESR